MGCVTDKLAENIRAFRKQRGLTQEQLSEVLGVTVGAVYKWEAGLSQPELATILELADFFDTSVDVLIGYLLRDNRLQATLARLQQCKADKDRAGLSEAEKALKKYPHLFSVVYAAAGLYGVFGMQEGDKVLLRRAVELLESARQLLAQNDNPRISDSTISAYAAQLLIAIGEPEQAVERLKSLNADGIYSDVIGLTLAADGKQPEEAVPYLSEALVDAVKSLIQVVIGYVNVFSARKDWMSAQAILHWGIGIFVGLKKEGKPCFLDKVCGLLYVCLADAQEESGDTAGAAETLQGAWALAQHFDAAPDYRVGALRFVEGMAQANAYDDFGQTAEEGVRKVIRETENAALIAMWEEMVRGEG